VPESFLGIKFGRAEALSVRAAKPQISLYRSHVFAVAIALGRKCGGDQLNVL